MSCDGRIDFPLEERKRLVDMLVYYQLNFLFKVSNQKTKYITSRRHTFCHYNIFIFVQLAECYGSWFLQDLLVSLRYLSPLIMFAHRHIYILWSEK